MDLSSEVIVGHPLVNLCNICDKVELVSGVGKGNTLSLNLGRKGGDLKRLRNSPASEGRVVGCKYRSSSGAGTSNSNSSYAMASKSVGSFANKHLEGMLDVTVEVYAVGSIVILWPESEW